MVETRETKSVFHCSLLLLKGWWFVRNIAREADASGIWHKVSTAVQVWHWHIPQRQLLGSQRLVKKSTVAMSPCGLSFRTYLISGLYLLFASIAHMHTSSVQKNHAILSVKFELYLIVIFVWISIAWYYFETNSTRILKHFRYWFSYLREKMGLYFFYSVSMTHVKWKGAIRICVQDQIFNYFMNGDKG